MQLHLQWKGNKHYMSCVPVALGMQHAVGVHHLSFVASPARQYFPHCLITTQLSRKGC